MIALVGDGSVMALMVHLEDGRPDTALIHFGAGRMLSGWTDIRKSRRAITDTLTVPSK
ncbi:MAG TPA: hypothetical protein VH023_15305 [Rhodopila sp.]|jgi:hypothetical protein|nr:hypothetical protein [Rhodopila sp.]